MLFALVALFFVLLGVASLVLASTLIWLPVVSLLFFPPYEYLLYSSVCKLFFFYFSASFSDISTCKNRFL